MSSSGPQASCSAVPRLTVSYLASVDQRSFVFMQLGMRPEPMHLGMRDLHPAHPLAQGHSRVAQGLEEKDPSSILHDVLLHILIIHKRSLTAYTHLVHRQTFICHTWPVGSSCSTRYQVVSGVLHLQRSLSWSCNLIINTFYSDYDASFRPTTSTGYEPNSY